MTPRSSDTHGLLKDPGLRSLIKAHEAATQQQAQRAQDLVKALVAKSEDTDGECVGVKKAMVALRARIHHQRLLIGRKRFGLQTRMKAIEKIKADMAKCEERERQLSGDMEALQQKLQAARNNLAAKVAEQLRDEGIPT